jgi:hypothetical protein
MDGIIHVKKIFETYFSFFAVVQQNKGYGEYHEPLRGIKQMVEGEAVMVGKNAVVDYPAEYGQPR